MLSGLLSLHPKLTFSWMFLTFFIDVKLNEIHLCGKGVKSLLDHVDELCDVADGYFAITVEVVFEICLTHGIA